MSDSDRVVIRDLRVTSRIGVTDAERSEPRPLLINLEVTTDLAPAGRTDDLSETVDYSAVAGAVTELASVGESKLLEHLAHKIADRVLAFAGATAVRVEITKESPPMAEDVRAVAVVIERSVGER
ncbi:MAG: dihydroneopterin aldolase [Actinomycetota bacterium]